MEAWAQEKFPSPLENAAALGGLRVVDQAIGLIEGYAELEVIDPSIQRVND